MLLLVGFVVLARHGSANAFPRSFLPDEDQGYVFAGLSCPMPPRFSAPMKHHAEIEEMIMKTPGVEHYATVLGFSLLSGVQNTYSAFLLDHSEGMGGAQSAGGAIRSNLRAPEREFSKITEGVALSLSAAGHSRRWHHRRLHLHVGGSVGQRSSQFLSENLTKFLAAARKRPELADVYTTCSRPSCRRSIVNVDRAKVHRARRAALGRLQNAADVHGRLFSELLQPFRTAMAGLRSGRRRLPQHGRERRTVLRHERRGQLVPLSA